LVGQAYRLLLITSALFTTIGGLSVIMLVDDLVPSVNRWVVTAVVLAGEVTVLALFLRVNALLMRVVAQKGTHVHASARRPCLGGPSRARLAYSL
jgi:hypothetical protein